jgi:hypothetical protein
VRFENGHRHSGLDDQRFVIFQGLEGFNNRMITFPVAGAFSNPAIDDQAFGRFRVLHVVFQHAQQGFLFPSLAAQCGATLGFY